MMMMVVVTTVVMVMMLNYHHNLKKCYHCYVNIVITVVEIMMVI